MIIYPEVTFTEEWKEGRRFERERIIKILKNTPNLEENYNILMNAVCTKRRRGERMSEEQSKAEAREFIIAGLSLRRQISIEDIRWAVNHGFDEGVRFAKCVNSETEEKDGI